MSLFNVYFAANVYQGIIRLLVLDWDRSISASGITFVCQVPSIHIGPTASGRMVNSCRISTWFTRAYTTATVMPFVVHLIIIVTNVLINQAESYYIITDYNLIWDRSHLHPVTRMITLLLHSTSALLQSCVIPYSEFCLQGPNLCELCELLRAHKF